jgi:hypothetical protein
VLVLQASDFSALAGSLPEFRRGFEEIARRRSDANRAGAGAADGDGAGDG